MSIKPKPSTTKLGQVQGQDAMVSKKSASAFLSGIFRSGISLRSFANIAQANPDVLNDRLPLKREELEQTISRDLKVIDPQAPKNPVRLRFLSNTFEDVQTSGSIIVNKERNGLIGPVSLIKVEAMPENDEENPEEEVKEGVLRNQFNFCDRATQGYMIHFLDQGCITEAPKPVDCTGSATQREIAAAYSVELKKQLLPPPHSAAAVTRIMERVVNQNLDPNAFQDFKYFDDPRDAFSKTSGYTLPLFEFRADILAGCQVTGIKWNPTVPDLFAAVYAPGDKSQNQHGYVCSWTLKNQSTPRNVLELSSPALSLDWCKSQPSLIAAGTSDGNISIYDVRSHRITPMYTTISLPDRHSAGVTVVRWQPEDASGNLQLLSAGLDGRILLWTMVQSEMKVTEISKIPAGVISLDYFNEQSTHYTIAADDGKIYKVLRTRTTQEPEEFTAHSPPLLNLTYNRFHTAVFASTGADWSVKIWREGQTNEPLQLYDYAPSYATDIQFAPHSSTVFSVVTSNGELFIYDIDINRYEAICRTPVVETQDGALTAVCFHPKWPVILIGDEKGRIHALKLSPNMRINTMTKR